jgi:hypothetical protein
VRPKNIFLQCRRVIAIPAMIAGKSMLIHFYPHSLRSPSSAREPRVLSTTNTPLTDPSSFSSPLAFASPLSTSSSSLSFPLLSPSESLCPFSSSPADPHVTFGLWTFREEAYVYSSILGKQIFTALACLGHTPTSMRDIGSLCRAFSFSFSSPPFPAMCTGIGFPVMCVCNDFLLD